MMIGEQVRCRCHCTLTERVRLDAFFSTALLVPSKSVISCLARSQRADDIAT